MDSARTKKQLLPKWVLETLTGIQAPIFAILGGLIMGGVFLLLTGNDILHSYAAMIDGIFGGRNNANIYTTIVRTGPVVGMALCACIAFKAGLHNIGGEGQMELGALAATLVGIYFPIPAIPRIILAFVIGMTVSGSYAVFATFLNIKLKIPLLITTLILNYPARFFAAYVVTYPFRDYNTPMNQSKMIDETLRFPLLFPPTQLHFGLLIILTLTIAFGLILKYTKFGYHIRMAGFNSRSLLVAGENLAKLNYKIMFLSGAVAGIAGAVEVFGLRYRFIDGMLANSFYAWNGLMVALLSSLNPYGILFAGFLFASIQNGGLGMERLTQVPHELSQIIQALIIILLGLKDKLIFWKSAVKSRS